MKPSMEYEESLVIASFDYSFKALIFAAMRKASTSNLDRLRLAFPYYWQELQELQKGGEKE